MSLQGSVEGAATSDDRFYPNCAFPHKRQSTCVSYSRIGTNIQIDPSLISSKTNLRNHPVVCLLDAFRNRISLDVNNGGTDLTLESSSPQLEVSLSPPAVPLSGYHSFVSHNLKAAESQRRILHCDTQSRTPIVGCGVYDCSQLNDARCFQEQHSGENIGNIYNPWLASTRLLPASISMLNSNSPGLIGSSPTHTSSLGLFCGVNNSNKPMHSSTAYSVFPPQSQQPSSSSISSPTSPHHPNTGAHNDGVTACSCSYVARWAAPGNRTSRHHHHHGSSLDMHGGGMTATPGGSHPPLQLPATPHPQESWSTRSLGAPTHHAPARQSTTPYGYPTHKMSCCSAHCEETAAVTAPYDTPTTTPSTAATSASSSRAVGAAVGSGGLGNSGVASHVVYQGPDPAPPVSHTRLYDAQGPVVFSVPPSDGGQHPRAELRSWAIRQELIISQNSSKRKVHRGLWLSPLFPDTCFPVAVKFVEDKNARDGRSIKREIECHLFIQQRLHQIQKDEGYPRLEDAWPSAELFGYHLDKKNPGRCMLITRKLSGPDFFDVIRQEHNSTNRVNLAYEYHKLHWCALALKRVLQYARLGIRHNDVKPDNIVLDFYATPSGERALDVKIIDLGTASMHSAKEFTGGTSWYESPEQKVLEYYSKKQRNPEAAKQVDIGLTSDVWAAGLSITEVLVGRRVVDSLKLPQGPGPLDYRGPAEGWVLQPEEWVEKARRALLSAPRETCKYTFCFDAAKYIFDRLVRPIPNERGTLQEAIDKMAEQTEKAVERSKKGTHSRSHTSSAHST